MAAALALFPVVTVHCFACPHVVSDPSPRGAHDLMETHYRRDHAAVLARYGAQFRRPVTGWREGICENARFPHGVDGPWYWCTRPATVRTRRGMWICAPCDAAEASRERCQLELGGAPWRP